MPNLFLILGTAWILLCRLCALRRQTKRILKIKSRKERAKLGCLTGLRSHNVHHNISFLSLSEGGGGLSLHYYRYRHSSPRT
ncbi:hypothetical protein B0F90DRAFT_1786444 [Multifurca ochricompacta]|uniref:Secreted protein n=1 Tax=Multifurca ochricompacta TaxID=376703 RepID=A0AAD4LU67_9AGAM|nr:hypothetical protein B0F90DRAFT_1786444 [Multifurca ochricompacta]